MEKPIYCPLCMARGKKKILGKYDPCRKHIGVLYLWCKEDKAQITIDLEKIDSLEPQSH